LAETIVKKARENKNFNYCLIRSTWST